MASTAQQLPPDEAAESSHPSSLVPESPETDPGKGLEPTDASISALSARVDGMREWASKSQSHIRGLLSGMAVLNERTAALEQLAATVDLIGTQVGELSSGAAVHAEQLEPLDRAIGYQASIEQQQLLFAALAEWQITAAPLEKGQVANIATKSGNTVSYRYADIAAVSEIARSAGACGLAHFHREIVIHGQSFIRTYLVHKGGGWISCDVPLLQRENTLISSLQQWASACTMARRYGLFMVLGIAAGDEDDDGLNASRRPGQTSTPAARTSQAAASRTPSPR